MIDRLNGTTPPADHEVFLLHEPATGKSIAVRDAQDAQLLKAFTTSNQALTEISQQVGQLLEKLVNTAKINAVVQYEIDRRRRTITIATPLDLRGLRT